MDRERRETLTNHLQGLQGIVTKKLLLVKLKDSDRLNRVSSQVPLSPNQEVPEGWGDLEGPPDEPSRGEWTGKFDFLLSLLGYSVGLGNVWRFPYLVYNNGGGAFLIPFVAMLILAGLPLMFMELSFGQYASLGPAAIFQRFCPLFKGLGYGMVVVSSIVMLYYNLLIAWTVFYLFASFTSHLPWSECDLAWSTPACYSYQVADSCAVTDGVYFNRTCYEASMAKALNITGYNKDERRTPAHEYFMNRVVNLSSGIEETGSLSWRMALCLLIAWLIVFLCLIKGVQSSGKVVYFTALFPYFVLVLLFFRGVTLPGAGDGVAFYLTPDWSRLASASVWGDAAVQIFFALSPAWGGLITLASYNKFNNNCYKDSLIVATSNVLTSFFAGFVIFSIIGYLAHELKVPVSKVVNQGAALAFIVYPEVVTRLPISPMWAILFFVMLLTLGLDSQFALMETVTTAVLDGFPNLRENKPYVVFFTSVAGYIGGLLLTTQAGMYWLQLLDKYAANWSVLVIAILECVIIAWVYGTNNFIRDIEEMIGMQGYLWRMYWTVVWKYLSPMTLIFILVFNWIEYEPARMGDYVYPVWANVIGWIIALLPIAVVGGMAYDELKKCDKETFMDKVRHCLKPTAEWGPSRASKRAEMFPERDLSLEGEGLHMNFGHLSPNMSNSTLDGGKTYGLSNAGYQVSSM